MMLIKSITLNNFRQYKGEQKIEFATKQPRNITVVKGENGAGKTTLLQAFLWCFYENMNLPKTEKIYNAELFNNINHLDEIEVWVEVEFIHNEEEYSIRRESKYHKISATEASRIATPRCTIKKKSLSGGWNTIDSIEIERKIPEDLSTYFFFDGERIENISKSNSKGKKDISKAVKNLLGLDILSNLVAQLKKVSNMFEKEYRDENTEGIKRINDELDDLREKEGKYSKEIETIENERKILEKKISENNKKIKANENVAKLQEERESLEKRIQDEEISIQEIKIDIQKNNKQSLPEFLCNKLLNLYSDKIDLSTIETKGIVGMDGAAIDYILERGECICGQKIPKGSQQYYKLLNQKEYQPPASLGTIMTQFNEKKASINEKGSDFYGVFKSKYLNIESKKNYIEDYEERIEEISKSLKGTDNVKELETTRDQYMQDKEILENRLIDVKVKLNDTMNSIIQKQTELSNLALTNDRNKVIELRKRYTDELIKIIDNKYKEKEKNIQKVLNKRVSKLFSELIDTKHILELNDDYTFRVIDIDGEDSTSQGQDVVTSFAFIGGLIDIAKETHKEIEENEPYPLIMDAPFAKLSKVHRRNVAKIIPNITEQFILFSVDSQYEGDIEENIKEKVGKQYELIMHHKNGKYTEIREV